MLKIKLVDEQITLNNFHYVEIKEYIAGQPFSLKLQIQDSETLQRLIPEVDANLNAIFQKRDGTELTVPGAMIFNPDDRSMWTINVVGTDSIEIVGSNVRIELDFNGSASAPPDLSDSTDLRVGMAYSILSKVTFDGEC